MLGVVSLSGSRWNERIWLGAFSNEVHKAGFLAIIAGAALE